MKNFIQVGPYCLLMICWKGCYSIYQKWRWPGYPLYHGTFLYINWVLAACFY